MDILTNVVMYSKRNF